MTPDSGSCIWNTQFREVDGCSLVQTLVYEHTQLVLYPLKSVDAMFPVVCIVIILKNY